MPRVELVGGDTMNLWINIKRAELLETLKEVDILLINDGEAKLLASEQSLVLAAKKILTLGPKSLVIKHGEYGATIFFADGSHPFRAPALPIARGARPHRRRRHFCRRLHGLHRLAAGDLTAPC